MKRIALIAILFLLIMMPSVSASEGPVNPPPAGLWQPAFGSTPSTGNYVYLKSDYGDYIGAGQTYSYTLANAQISVSATGGYLSVSIVGDQNWTGNFQAMSGISQLQLGYYGNLQRYSFHNPVLGGLDWSGEGRGSNTLTGWFAIDNITYANGILTAIDLRFEQHSEGGSPALHGQIHWRLDDTTASPGPVNPPPAGLWQPASGSTFSTGNYVYLKSDYGDYIGAGQTYSYTLANAQISVSATGGHLSVSIVGDQNWTGNFQAMSGISQLQLGYYGNLHRYPFHNPVLGGLDWSGEGRGSNTLTGWFAIDNITYANGILTAIDLRFEQHSEGGSPALHGQIHWRLDDTAIAIAILQGDIDNSGIVDLQDAIIALQIFSGMNVVIPVYPSADVNGYGQIGIAEAIYALQCLARLRNNHAPVLTAIGNQTVDEGALLTFTISATDMDGDTITYSVSTPPSGATLNSSNGTFSWTPTYAQSGTYQVTFNVRDDYGGKASETITITVNDKPPVYTAAEYYPINVGDWHDYADTTGNTYHSTVTGTRLIGSMLTMVEADWTGTQSYITSDQNGIKIYGQYDPAYKVEIIFGTPLLMVPPIPQLGTPQVSMSYYSMIYSGQLFHVNVTSTVNIIGIEDVQTENMVLKDCIKISSRLDQFLVERGQYVSGDTSYQWFYKGVGMVKQVSGSDTYVISASFVNGVAQNY